MKPAPAMRPSNRAVLTPEQVREIRNSPQPGKIFAIDLKVSEATISRVRRGSRWGWVR